MIFMHAYDSSYEVGVATMIVDMQLLKVIQRAFVEPSMLPVLVSESLGVKYSARDAFAS